MTWNTTTFPTDKERLRIVLGIPVEKQWLNILQMSMDRVENVSPDSVGTAQTLLDEWEQTKAEGSALKRSENYALVRADVLEWESGSRGAGFEERLAEIKQELATLLYIDPPEIGGSNGAVLYRS